MLSSRSAEMRTAFAAAETLGAALLIGSKLVPALLGSKLSQDSDPKTSTSGDSPRLATSSAVRATSDTALKFAPTIGRPAAILQVGSSAASRAVEACDSTLRIISAAWAGRFSTRASLSRGTSCSADSSSLLIIVALKPSQATAAVAIRSNPHTAPPITSRRIRRVRFGTLVRERTSPCRFSLYSCDSPI